MELSKSLTSCNGPSFQLVILFALMGQQSTSKEKVLKKPSKASGYHFKFNWEI